MQMNFKQNKNITISTLDPSITIGQAKSNPNIKY